jgi:hypothetical protein
LGKCETRVFKTMEESYHELKEKLQADLKEDFDYYQRAKDLYDQLDIIYEESYTVQEEVE